MAMPNLAAVNERINAAINELSRLQRQIQAEIDARDVPADARLTRAEWERQAALEADDKRAAEVAVQSAAMGNTDAGTQAQAKTAKADEPKK